MQDIIDHLSNDVYQDVERKMRAATTKSDQESVQQELDALEETIHLLWTQQQAA